jgi:hypothetical protein
MNGSKTSEKILRKDYGLVVFVQLRSADKVLFPSTIPMVPLREKALTLQRCELRVSKR